MTGNTKKKHLWWQEGVIYQIYPRSFQDSVGDGVGDIPGIIQRLDYLQWLGVDVLWISPIYPSPMKDFGYDISDYTGVHPMFGTLNDVDKLITELHTRGMKIVLDLVPNHTSDQHPWFIESRSAKNNSKRNWYIWRDARTDGTPPNNWLSVFAGSAWQWDELTGQYYYHAFLKEQPDLNYREPAVMAAMEDVMRFWLNHGVDGFRIDVMWHMIKDELLRDNPPNPAYQPQMPDCDSLLPVFSTDQPEVHSLVSRFRKTLDAYNERMMIGEVYLPIDKLVTYYGTGNSGAHLPFNFLLVLTRWDAMEIATAIDAYEAALPAGAWPNWVLGNHDQSRIRSRIGLEQAKVAAVLLLTLRGTPTLYYGDELGMADVPVPAEEVKDPQGLNMPDKNLSRDPARTPMQWDASENAGFTTGIPWLRPDKMYRKNNVSVQQHDPDSILWLYHRLLTLRRQEAALKTGTYKRVYTDRFGMAYTRTEGNVQFLIALNLSHRTCYFKFNEAFSGVIVVATERMLEGTRMDGRLMLSGDEAVIIKLEDNNNQ
jgi:alpha-glucosidase